MSEHYAGTCDVCEAEISTDHDAAQGMIDYAFDDEGRKYTWIRHIDGPRPECEIYSSRVWLT